MALVLVRAPAAHVRTFAPRKTARPRFVRLLRQTVAAWLADHCTKLAAALACYAVLSLAPLVVILFKIVRVVLHDDRSQELLTRHLQGLIGGGADSELIRTILESSKQGQGTLATSISVVVLLFGASGVFGELQDSMNRIWRAQPAARGFMRWITSRFLSMSMVLGTGFLLLVSLFVSTLLSTLSQSFLGDSRVAAILLDLLLSIAVITLMMAMIFKWLPDTQVAWSDVWLGAFVTALLFIAGKWGLTLYFQFGAPTSAYGVFGSLAAVVIWVYYAAQILFFGAEFTRVRAQSRGKPLR